jgi:hypothetical protein
VNAKKQAAGSPKQDFASWHRHLERLHQDLTGLEQSLECTEALLSAFGEKRSRFVFPFIAGAFGQLMSIGVRRLYRRGSSKYQNVALSRLLDSIEAQPETLLRFGDPSSIRIWTQVASRAAPTSQDVLRAIVRDRARLEASLKNVASYADTIAHLQIGRVTIKGKAVAAAVADLRRTIDEYHRVIGEQGPWYLDPSRFTAGVEEELDQLVVGRLPQRPRGSSRRPPPRT